MKINVPIAALLHLKNPKVWFVASSDRVFDAIRLMTERNVGALPVLDGGRLVGIISERDYTRKVVLKGRSSRDATVAEIMTADPFTVTPAATIEDCMKLMTEQRVRHLPIMDRGKMVGIVSIGDVVKWIISVQADTIDQLQQYIANSYPV